MTIEATALPDAPAPDAAPDAAAADKTTSLADHAALYGPPDPTLEGEAKVQNEDARAKVRHRAKSQQASPEDAPRIAELTRRLRETEAERDALKAPKSSPARVDPPVGTATAPVAAAATRPATTPPAETAPKPSVDQIGVEGGFDTYEDYVEALTDWKADQRDAARQQREQEAQQARQQQEAAQGWHKAHQTYGERLVTFKAQHADFDALLESHGAVNIPAAPYQAILAAESGPAWVYHLLQHPDQLAELALLFDGKTPTEAMIAHATRWLTGRAAVVPAAAAAAPALSLAPRPPSPVRTGAARGDNAPLDDDSMSIEAHEKAYGRRRR